MFDSCRDHLRHVFEVADRPMTINEVTRACEHQWQRHTVAENTRVLHYNGELRVVGTGGPNKREKLYEKVR
jgi:hypothetical protein